MERHYVVFLHARIERASHRTCRWRIQNKHLQESEIDPDNAAAKHSDQAQEEASVDQRPRLESRLRPIVPDGPEAIRRDSFSFLIVMEAGSGIEPLFAALQVEIGFNPINYL